MRNTTAATAGAAAVNRLCCVDEWCYCDPSTLCITCLHKFAHEKYTFIRYASIASVIESL